MRAPCVVNGRMADGLPAKVTAMSCASASVPTPSPWCRTAWPEVALLTRHAEPRTCKPDALHVVQRLAMVFRYERWRDRRRSGCGGLPLHQIYSGTLDSAGHQIDQCYRDSASTMLKLVAAGIGWACGQTTRINGYSWSSVSGVNIRYIQLLLKTSTYCPPTANRGSDLVSVSSAMRRDGARF